jgi:glycosyltransferase involved in cell wall biosynthesis
MCLRIDGGPPLTALSAFNRSDVLRTIYLLRQDLRGTRTTPSEAEAGSFLLWVAVHGRTEYHGLVIDPEFFDYITGPAHPYLTRLERYAVQGAGNSVANVADIRVAHLWYYVHGVKALNLEIFITERELRALDKIPAVSAPAGAGLSLLDEAIYDSESELRRFKFSDPAARPVLEDWRRRQAGSLTRPWPRINSPNRPARCVGINLIGYAEGVLGIGEDVRAHACMLRYCGIPFVICNVALSEKHATSEPSGLTALFSDRPVFPLNIFCVTGFEMQRLLVERGANLVAGRYNIGLWPWELNAVPSYWRHMFDAVDEVWAISPWLAEVYGGATKKPVVYMPPHVNVDAVETFDRADLGIDPDDFVFLAMLDFNSSIARKNPEGTIRAFRAAFPDKSGAERLVIKTINGHVHPERIEHLLALAEDDPRIVLVDGPLPRPQICGLIAAADCFVSLHRSEGFGRVIAEAMLLGTPVVATDWSGSKVLLDTTTGFPVACRLRDVAPGEYAFEEGSQWAEPDLDDAATQFRTVRQDAALIVRKTAKAKKMVARNHGLEQVSLKLVQRLAEITSSM